MWALRDFLRDSSPARASGTARLKALRLPAGTDWRWRPDVMMLPLASASGIAAPGSGTMLTDEIKLWHDCPDRALVLRQFPTPPGDPTLAPFTLRLEGFGFGGSYLSLSIDLPEAGRTGLGRDHIVRLDAALTSERAASIHLRLNLSAGPNTEQLQAQLMPGATSGRAMAEFDLGRLGFAAAPDKLWLDLIVEAPVMNRIDIQDLMLSRRPRAHV